MTPGANPLIVIQARCGSTRLPNKVLADLCGEPVLAWVIRRCIQSSQAGGVVVATSVLERDDAVAEISAGLQVPVFRGSETDVLSRYVEAARSFSANVLVRVTADCPFVDPAVIDEVIGLHLASPGADYVGVRNYPEGLGAAEVLRVPALQTALARTTPADTHYREHVMTFLTAHGSDFELLTPEAPRHLQRAGAHFSIDTPVDLENARKLAAFFHPSRSFHIDDILAWMDSAAAPKSTTAGQPD